MLDVKPRQKAQVKQRHEEPDADHCSHFPELVRMNYFHGQMLAPRDFLAEQAYHRAKHLLINRCLHGYGVVCGLDVAAVPDDQPCPDPDAERRRDLEAAIAKVESDLAKAEKKGSEEAIRKLETRLEELRRELEALGVPDCPPPAKQENDRPEHRLTLGCGLAIAPDGHEIVVHSEAVVDLDRLIDEDGWKRIAGEAGAEAWLSICYAECGLETVRPGNLDQCQITPGCQDSRIREGWTVHLSFDAPEADDRCEYCCGGSCDGCVLIARVRIRPKEGLREDDVYGGVRRPFGLYAPTVITGINWRHGDSYSPLQAQELSGADDGEGAWEIRFSRGIRVETIKPGVIELLSFSGGRGESGTVNHLAGEFVDLPATGLVDRIRYRDITGERPQRGDRIMLIVRCAFLLDACCRAPDGMHVGGRVGLIDDHEDRKDDQKLVCSRPPGRAGAAWASGSGTYGSSFESWIFISKDKEAKA